MLYFSKAKIIVILLVVLAGAIFTAPNFFTKEQMASWPGFIPKSQMALGLDLQGGAQLVLQVDTPSLVRERLDSLRDGVRRALRDDRIGYSGGIGVRDKSVTVRITDPANIDKAETKLRTLVTPIGGGLLGGSSVNDLTVTRGDNGLFTLTLTDDGIEVRSRQAVEQSIEVVRRRIDALGTTEPYIARQGANRLRVEVPGYSDTEYLKTILKQTAKMTFHMVISHHEAALTPDRSPDAELFYTRPDARGGEGKVPVLVEKVPLLSGAELVDAQPTFDQNQEPVVSFRFNTSGARKFADVTQANVGKLFAIVLDKEVITYPRINGPIPGGSGIITGSFTVQSATDLALLLRAGSLPAGLTVVEERTVGPGLGADSIAAGKVASLVGVAGVAFYMILNYGLFGLFANVAVIINVMFTFAILSTFGGDADLARHRRHRARRRHGGRRQRADLRAHTRGADGGTNADRLRRHRLQARHRHHLRRQLDARHRRARPVLFRHRPDQGLRADADGGHAHLLFHRGHDHPSVRDAVAALRAADPRAAVRSRS